MNKPRTSLLYIILLTAVLVLILACFISFRGDRSGQALIGEMAPKPVSIFLSPEDMSGESFVILSDMYVDECNERMHEMVNHMAKLSDQGINIRMLHTGHGMFPNKSFDDAVKAKRGPLAVIIADMSVLYAEPTIRGLPKPCVIQLNDGKVVAIRVKDEFEKWMQQGRQKDLR